MKCKKIIFILSLFLFQINVLAQTDTIKIYWNNNKIKYMSICCYNYSLKDGFYVQCRKSFFYNDIGIEIDKDDFFLKYNDIIDTKKIDVFISKEVEKYIKIINTADSLLDGIYRNKNYIKINEVNNIISLYNEAQNIIPDANYPKNKLIDLNEFLTRISQ